MVFRRYLDHSFIYKYKLQLCNVPQNLVYLRNESKPRSTQADIIEFFISFVQNFVFIKSSVFSRMIIFSPGMYVTPEVKLNHPELSCPLTKTITMENLIR